MCVCIVGSLMAFSVKKLSPQRTRGMLKCLKGEKERNEGRKD